MIKEADKGSAVVVWDINDYLQEADQQLSDKDVYEEVTGEFISPLVNTIKQCIAKIKIRGDVSQQTVDYFFVENPRIGRFYLLPKIHKRLFSVPGRPVISNCGFYTENISAFVDYHLQPLARKVKSYIKDTNDFLKKLKNIKNLPNDYLLCTVDVVGLYPNIPHDDGLAAVKKALDRREDKTISSDSLLELTECVLKNNVFEHNNKTFRQKQGTAIGTKMAPPYAILFMSDLENTFLENSPLKPFVLWRYIDDIFMIWQHGEEELTKFLQDLNSCHPTIKFTSEFSKDKINFLDVMVYRDGDHLVTDLYVKPTDTHQYLHATSCHVFHCKRSIPFSQALRLNRICSQGKFFDLRCNQLEEWLISTGYSGKMVRREVLKARKFDRNYLLDKEQDKKPPPDLVLNITYHPALNKIKSILSNIHILLTPNKEHEKVFQQVPVVGFRRGKSLKDILVRAKLPKEESGYKGCKGCGKPCQVCPYIATTDTFSNKEETRTYNIRAVNLNCKSPNIVYMLRCKQCNIQYIGSCITPFWKRFNNYKSCQKRYSSNNQVPQANVHSHFYQYHHHNMDDFEFILIDQGRDFKTTRRKEAFWQHTLDTFEPKGLNACFVPLDLG